ncbi:MAG TPA: DUF3040 domain-containing protein [Actinopolymorphaceae bacterium]
MPLSDHEQRLLEQMERALAAEDPKLASALRGVDQRVRQRRRAAVGVAAFVVGMVMLFGGAVMTTAGRNVVLYVVVSVFGFLVMLVSAYYVATSLRRMPAAGEVATNVVPIKPGRRNRRPSQTGFMSRMEERWRRRRESGY